MESLNQKNVCHQTCPQDIHAVVKELSVLKEQMKKLQNEKEVKQVAFSASQLDQGEGETGPFNTEVILIFKHVFINIGKAYNPSTGIFTAPVKGVYHFDFKVYGQAGLPAGALLYKNGDLICIAFESPNSGGFGVSSSNAAPLLLDVGDQVFVRLYPNTKIYDNHNHHTTFSGHLIFTTL